MNKCDYCIASLSKEEKEKCRSIVEASSPVSICVFAQLHMAVNIFGAILACLFKKLVARRRTDG